MELTTKEWQELLDTYLITNQIDIDLFQKANQEQLWLLNEVKKSIARIKNK